MSAVFIPKNAIIYTTTDEFTADRFAAACENRPFLPCAPTAYASKGFVPPLADAPDLMLHSVDGIHAFAFRIDTKLLPASIINAATAERIAELEAEQNRTVGKMERNNMREAMALHLLQVAFVKTAIVRGWLDEISGLLVIDTASQTRADDVSGGIFSAWQGDKLVLHALANDTAPAQHFHTWIATGEAPVDFSIDNAGKFIGPDNAKLNAQNVDLAEERMKTIATQMACVELSLTHADKISFRLTQTLAMKGIKLIGIDTAEDMQGDLLPEEKADAELTVSAGLISRAAAALVAAVRVTS